MNGEIIAGIALLFMVGIIGWKLFALLRFPAPDMLGALFLAAVVGVLGWNISFPTEEVTFFSKLVVGSYIGLKVNRAICSELRKALLPALLVSLWMLVASIVSGFALYWMTHLPLATALLGSTTGGVSEMALLGFSLGADTVGITVLQVFRVVLFLVLVPFIARCVNSRKNREERPFLDDPEREPGEPLTGKANTSGVTRLILVAVAGGSAGVFLGLPAGDLLGSMAAVGTWNVLRGNLSRVHPTLASLARIGVGLAIAQEVTRETLIMLSGMFLPVMLLAILMILSGIILSWVLYRITGWSYCTCLLVSSPGGLTQMSIIADELDADPLMVSVLHTVRLISVLTVLPLFFRFLMG